MNTNDELSVISDTVVVSYLAFGPHPDGVDDNAFGITSRASLKKLPDSWDDPEIYDLSRCIDGDCMDCEHYDDCNGMPPMHDWLVEVHADGGSYAVKRDDLYADVQWIENHRGWYTHFPLGGLTSCGDPQARTEDGVFLIQQDW